MELLWISPRIALLRDDFNGCYIILGTKYLITFLVFMGNVQQWPDCYLAASTQSGTQEYSV